jgi:23S rRNA pseudoU1915 N3-methylase RlmH
MHVSATAIANKTMQTKANKTRQAKRMANKLKCNQVRQPCEATNQRNQGNQAKQTKKATRLKQNREASIIMDNCGNFMSNTSIKSQKGENFSNSRTIFQSTDSCDC